MQHFVSIFLRHESTSSLHVEECRDLSGESRVSLGVLLSNFVRVHLSYDAD